jgi:hypothetical protein
LFSSRSALCLAQSRKGRKERRGSLNPLNVISEINISVA